MSRLSKFWSHALVLVLLLLALVGAGCGSAATREPSVQSRLPTIQRTDLPPQARKVLKLVARGGPFPYDKDGTVFENREELLPIRDYGYYHEYTVRTPGERDRGARRIVAGSKRERYYTDDHYASFRKIVR